MIYVFLANGFEEVEALAPVDMLRRAKLDVTTVGVTGKIVTGSHHIPVTADITAEELQIGADMEMIVLPGGMPGTLNEEASQVVQAAIDYCAENDRWIGAICAAPSILGHKGLLQGKTATCYTGFEKDLLGAEIGSDGVIRDGKIVEAHAEKGEEFLKAAISVDEGASYFGEVALVPYDSPISNQKILFYNTLFDENASCHLAFGEAYPECIEGGESMTREEVQAHGLNYSLTHVDFMVGTADLSIVGTTHDGREIPVFINGNFAI